MFVRTVILAACWLGYAAFPIVIGLFHVSHMDVFFWEERLMHALSILGYGTIGCLFHALTGREGVDHRGDPLPDKVQRFCQAAMWNVSIFVLVLLAM